MTMINLIAKWPLIVIKWVLTIVMALVFIISLLMILNLGWISKQLPTDMADLQEVMITVKSAVIARGSQFITPVEYPTQFAIDGQLPSDVVAKHPVNVGDHVDVYLTNEGLQILRTKSSIPTHMQAYGITLQNGEPLVDPKQFLDGKIKNHMRDVFNQIFSVALIYFIGLIIFTLIQNKRSKLNKQHT